MGVLRNLAAGDRGAIQEFTIGSASDQVRGYIAVFIKNNMVVTLAEIGPAQLMTAERVEAHAHTIEGRMR